MKELGADFGGDQVKLGDLIEMNLYCYKMVADSPNEIAWYFEFKNKLLKQSIFFNNECLRIKNVFH